MFFIRRVFFISSFRFFSFCGFSFFLSFGWLVGIEMWKLVVGSFFLFSFYGDLVLWLYLFVRVVGKCSLLGVRRKRGGLLSSWFVFCIGSDEFRK